MCAYVLISRFNHMNVFQIQGTNYYKLSTALKSILLGIEY